MVTVICRRADYVSGWHHGADGRFGSRPAVVHQPGQNGPLLVGAPTAGTLEEYWPDIEGLAKRDVVTNEAMPTETFFDCAVIHS